MNFKLIFVLATLLTSFYLPSSALASGTIQTVELGVEGMISNACPVILRSAIEDMDGVKKVDASLENHSAIIEYDAEQVSLSTLQKTIKEKAGFDTTPKQ